MRTDFSQIAPLLTSALVILVVYRRVRRSFGKQPLSSTRLTVRVVILALVGALLLPAVIRGWEPLAAALAGLIIGAALAWWGASQTKFARQNQQLYFVPHTYTGVIVSLLFLGRLAYRFAQSYGVMHATAAHGVAVPPEAADPSFGPYGAAMMRKPLTLGIYYVLMAYYVSYYSWVLHKSKRLTSADLEPAGGSAVIETDRAPPPASN
jgi:hypothetical protein